MVPSNGGNLYSSMQIASGSIQKVTLNTVSPTSTIYGTVNDSGYSNISSETTLQKGTAIAINSSAAKGEKICIMFETSVFNNDNPSITYSWTP